MKKILKSKKGWLSVGAILVALTLMVGATFAWFTYTNGGALDANVVAGKLMLNQNFPTDADDLQDEIDANFPNGVAQAGDFIMVRPAEYYDDEATGDECFFIENVGTLDAMVRVSTADFTVTLDAAYDQFGNYIGDAATVGAAKTFKGTFGDDFVASDGVAYENGITMGLKMRAIDPADGIVHYYDPFRGDHYFWLPVGEKIEFDYLFIDMKTNAYKNEIVDFDPETFHEDHAPVVLGPDARDAKILIDNKYQDCKVDITGVFGILATQENYYDAWIDTFDFLDGEWAGAHYGMFNDWDDHLKTEAGVWNTEEDLVGWDFYLPTIDTYFAASGVAGNANMIVKY